MQDSDSLLEMVGTQEDEQVYLRLRNVTLRLAESCSRAVEQRSDLAPVLSAALQHAVDKLLLDGESEDLIALEAWLQEETDEGRFLHHDRCAPDAIATHMLAA